MLLWLTWHRLNPVCQTVTTQQQNIEASKMQISAENSSLLRLRYPTVN